MEVVVALGVGVAVGVLLAVAVDVVLGVAVTVSVPVGVRVGVSVDVAVPVICAGSSEWLLREKLASYVASATLALAASTLSGPEARATELNQALSRMSTKLIPHSHRHACCSRWRASLRFIMTRLRMG